MLNHPTPAAFLAAFHARLPPGNGLVLRTVALDNVGSEREMVSHFPIPSGVPGYAAAVAWMKGWNARRRCAYFSVHPRFGRSGCAENVACITALVLDWDSAAEATAGLCRLTETGLAPSIVVKSGRGSHGYLLLDIPAPPSDAPHVGRRLRMLAGGDPVFPATQIMRLPETVNWKPTAAGAVCTVEHFLPDLRYSLDAVAYRLDAAGVPVPPPEGGSRPAPPRHRNEVAPASLSLPAMERVGVLLDRLPPRYRDLVLTGHLDSDGYKSRSEADFAVIRLLINVGAADDDIENVFGLHPNGIGDKTADRGPGYLSRTIDRARRTSRDLPFSEVEVVGSYPRNGMEPMGRLRLRVLRGPHRGTDFDARLKFDDERLWMHAFTSFGLPAPARRTAFALKGLVGRKAKVALAPWNETVEVRFWLPRDEED